MGSLNQGANDMVSEMKDITLINDNALPRGIKIRFKKGVIFADSETMGEPRNDGSGKKKEAHDGDLREDKRTVKRPRIKTGEAGDGQAINLQIYRKLARHLASEPALLEDLRAYSTNMTAQLREKSNAINALLFELGAMSKKAEEKERRAAEELTASNDMVQFWTGAYMDEYAQSIRLQEEVHHLSCEIESMSGGVGRSILPLRPAKVEAGDHVQDAVTVNGKDTPIMDTRSERGDY